MSTITLRYRDLDALSADDFRRGFRFAFKRAMYWSDADLIGRLSQETMVTLQLDDGLEKQFGTFFAAGAAFGRMKGGK